MGMTENKSAAVRVNVTPAMGRALEREARRLDVSVAHVIRTAVKVHLKIK